MVSSEADKRAATPAAVLIPLLPAALFYAIFLACLVDVYSTNFDGGGGEARLSSGLLSLWTTGTGGLLWLMLAVQLWVVHGAPGTPAWAAKAAPLLFLLSGGAAIFAVATMMNCRGGWSGLVPALLPPLVALYATWAGLPSLHRLRKPETVNAVLLAAIGLVIAVTVPLSLLDTVQAPQNAARLQAQLEAVYAKRDAEMERVIADANERYRNLTVDSPLADYLRYVTEDEEAGLIGRLRVVKSRQRDVVALLNDGRIQRLTFLPELDLTVAPELCTAYGAALRGLVDSDISVAPSWYRNVVDHLEQQLPNMKWLAAGGCNLNDSLTAAEAPLHYFIAQSNQYETEVPRWRQLLDTFAALRRS